MSKPIDKNELLSKRSSRRRNDQRNAPSELREEPGGSPSEPVEQGDRIIWAMRPQGIKPEDYNSPCDYRHPKGGNLWGKSVSDLVPIYEEVDINDPRVALTEGEINHLKKAFAKWIETYQSKPHRRSGALALKLDKRDEAFALILDSALHSKLEAFLGRRGRYRQWRKRLDKLIKMAEGLSRELCPSMNSPATGPQRSDVMGKPLEKTAQEPAREFCSGVRGAKKSPKSKKTDKAEFEPFEYLQKISFKTHDRKRIGWEGETPAEVYPVIARLHENLVRLAEKTKRQRPGRELEAARAKEQLKKLSVAFHLLTGLAPTAYRDGQWAKFVSELTKLTLDSVRNLTQEIKNDKSLSGFPLSAK